eukprot:1002817-Rhodomonas_salina.1
MSSFRNIDANTTPANGSSPAVVESTWSRVLNSSSKLPMSLDHTPVGAAPGQPPARRERAAELRAAALGGGFTGA